MYAVQSKRAQRLKEKGGLRAKAPIAAQFEDCFQAIQQLSDALQVNRSNSGLHNRSKDCELRLKLWGEDSGASSRILDYLLRNSPVLKRQTRRLLEDLHTTLQEAIAGVRLQDPDEPDAEDKTDTSSTSDASRPKEQSDAGAAKEDADEQDTDIGPELWIDDTNDLIGFLTQLLPALRDPIEETGALTTSHDIDAGFEEWYRQLANVLFPNVPPDLSLRLGESNWRRRQNIKRSLDKTPAATGGRMYYGRPATRNLKSWDYSQTENADKNSVQNQSTLADSDAATTTIRSYMDTVLSKTPVLDKDSATSATDSSPPQILQHLVLPPPPVDLSKVKQFDCPYCQCELPLTFSAEAMGVQEWTAHVYHDLKPYICTFGNCSHKDQPFSNRKDWFQHELNLHRSRLIWSCGICRSEFSQEDELVAHLQSLHIDIPTQPLSYMRETCKRYSHDQIGDQECVLCGQVYSEIDKLELHLGNHLETFALAAFLDDQSQDDGGFDGEEKVVDYITELHELRGYNEVASSTPMETRTMDMDLVETDGDHAMDASDLSAGDGMEVENRKVRDDPWAEKVENFLDTTQDSIQTIRHNVIPRYDNFVGRDVDLDNIHKHLSTPGRICTVSGRGGIGKTAIAVEYVYKYESEYSYVLWMEAETPGLLATKYGMIANSLNLIDKPLADQDARTYLVREALTKTDRRWLIIFDNAASWSTVSRYIPRNLARTKGSVLITTRTTPLLSIPSSHPAYHYQSGVELDVWPLEHGREFLLTSIQPKLSKDNLEAHDEYELAPKVVSVVGCLPLAISMIVGYVKVSRCTLADFLEMWEEKEHIKSKIRRKTEVDETELDATIDSLWTIGIREVRMNSRRLLDVLSLLDPETIQKSLLVGDHKEEYLEFLHSSETLSYKRMINELLGRRLISEKTMVNGETAYTIHRLLQTKIRLDMEDYGFADAFRKAFRLIRKLYPAADPQQVPNPRDWDTCEEYMPHLFTFRRIYKEYSSYASQIDPKPLELSELFYDAGFYIWARQGTAYDGLSFLESAEDLLDDMNIDQDAKLRADILSLKAVFLLSLGVVERSKGLNTLKEVWQVRQRIYQRDPTHDNDVLSQNAANDYSTSLLNEHEFEEAGKIMQDCHDRYLVWGPEEENPFENSKFYGNYSIVYLWRGDFAEAIAYQEKSIQLTETFSGRKAMFYRRVFWFGCILLQTGNVQAALEKHLEVLTARLDLHGKHHELTIMSMYAVGAMYHHLGDIQTAIEYISQCLECVKNSRWDRAALARAQYHLALLYRQQGIKEDEAKYMESEANSLLHDFGSAAADCLRGVDDKLMILDDLQPTLAGRYTGRNLLKHLQRHLRQDMMDVEFV
ncbi:hypothetical protein BX600DRAFT_448189 [Xylariales sp. PMI_506]|nr:hypothetical protein BX600DRAFT_448189 [Xylariales sp. PMI_506]